MSMSEYVYMWVHMAIMPEEGLGSPWVGVTGQ